MVSAASPLFDRLGWVPRPLKRRRGVVVKPVARRPVERRAPPLDELLGWSHGDQVRWSAALDALTPLQRTTVRAAVASAGAALATTFRVTPLAVTRRLERSVETLRRVLRGGVQLPFVFPRAQPLRLVPPPEPRQRVLRLVPPEPETPRPTPPCASCSLRASCRSLCGPMEALLSSEGMREEIDHHKELPKRPEVAEFLASKHHAELEGTAEIDDQMPAVERASWSDIATVARPALQRAIASVLPPLQREAVELLLSGTRQCDIARMRRVSKVTVCVMLRRARLRLQRELRHVELPT